MSPLALIPLSRRRGIPRAYALVDADDFAWLSGWNWSLMGDTAGRNVTIGGRRKTMLMHRQIMGVTDPNVEVDHIGGDRLDNRRSRLRVVTHAQNLQNLTHLSRANSSGYRGVFFDAAKGRWRACVKLGGRRHYLGFFDDVHEAGRVVAAFRAAHMPFSPDARRAA